MKCGRCGCNIRHREYLQEPNDPTTRYHDTLEQCITALATRLINLEGRMYT